MVAQVQKNFFDINDNIFEVISTLQNLSESRAIFIFPVDSVVFSGIVNMKLLDKYVKELKLPLIIVTEDSYGFKLAQKAGLVTVQKMSQITPDLWMVAEKRAIVGKVDLNDNTPIQEEVSSATTENLASIKNDNQSFEDAIEQEETKTSIHEEKNLEVDFVTKSLPVTVAGIQIFIDQDIKKVEADTAIMSDMERSKTQTPNSNMIGMDLGKAIASSTGRKKFKFPNLFKRKVNSEVTEEDSSVVQRRRKRLIIASVIGVLVLLLIPLFLSSIATVEIIASFQKQQVEESFSLLAEPNREKTSLNEDSVLASRLFEYEAKELSVSKTFSVSKQTTVGERARGTITFYNLTDSDLIISAGTQVESAVGKKRYIVLTDVVVPAVEENTLGEKVPQFVDNVSIEAVNVGASFNLSAASGDDNFVIQLPGFDDLLKANGRIFRDIAGGSSRDASIIIKEDVDKAREAIKKEIEDLLRERLKSLVPRNQIMLSELIELEPPKFTTSPDIGEEALDSQFSVSAVISGKAFAISADALTDAADLFFQTNLDANSGQAALLSRDFIPSITSVTKTASGALLTVGFTGNVGVGISPDNLFNLVSGKYITDAQSLIGELENIDRFTVQFKPAILPDFLKFIPSDRERVLIRIN